MDSLPSFRVDEGQVRIMFGMTVVDIGIMGAVWMALYLPFSNWFALIGGIIAGRLSVSLLRFIKRSIPSFAIRHFLDWMGQAAYYEPGPDPEPTPIFPQEER